VHDDLWCKLEKDELEQAQGESEAGPVVSVFKNLQSIAIEVNLAIKVHVVECLHGNLVAPAILGLIRSILEGKVVLNWAARERCLLGLARAERGCQIPEADQNRDGCEDAKENSSLEAPTDFPGQICGNNSNEGEQEEVRESLTARSIGWKRSIFYGWELQMVSVNSILICDVPYMLESRIRLTDVVLTPHSSNFSKVGVGALGVSMNSNSLSEPLTL
jgi:hypothetical protein